MGGEIQPKNKKIRQKREKMIIKFSNKIYKIGAVKSSAKAYRGLADFKISQTKDYIKAELKNIDQSVKNIIKDEFCNYVLAMMKT